VLDEGLPGYCDGEAVAHDSPFWHARDWP
jgi:hypothetical protein